APGRVDRQRLSRRYSRVAGERQIAHVPLSGGALRDPRLRDATASRLSKVRRAVKADFFILQTCEFLDSGDGYYRFHEPSRYLSRLPGVAVVDCGLEHHLLPPLLDAA